MTEDEVLSVILLNEGGFKNDPKDPADPTNYGITAAVFGEWQGLGRRAHAVEMQTLLTPAIAKHIYRKQYIEEPGFTSEKIPFEPLRMQLIDFGANSGPARAIRWLQRILRLPTTGVLDDMTTLTVHGDTVNDAWRERYLGLVNDALVAARSYMIDQSVDSKKVHAKYEEGLESRALSFFLAKPDPSTPVVASEARKV